MRFDGYKFKHYTTNNGLADNEHFSAYEDSQHRIWFPGYNGELSYFKNDTFYNRKNNALVARFKTSLFGRNVLEDERGTIYHASQQIIFSINTSGKEYFEKQKPQHHFLNFYLNEKKEMLVLSYNRNKLFIKNFSQLTIDSLKIDSLVMPAQLSRYVTIDNDNGIIYSSLKKLIKGDFRTKEILAIDSFPVQIQEILSASDTTVWIATHKGLHYYNWKKQKVEYTILKNTSVTHLFTDHEGHLWVTTISDGIYVFLNKAVKYQLDLPFLKALKIIPLKSNQLFITSNNFDGVLRNGSTFKTIQLPKYAGHGYVKSIARDSKDNYFIILSTGLLVTDKNLNIKQASKLYFKDIYITPDKNLLIGFGSGTCKIPSSELPEVLSNPYNQKLKLDLAIINKFYHDTFNQRLYGINKTSVKYTNDEVVFQNLDNDSAFNMNLISMIALNKFTLVIASEKNGLKIKYRTRNYYITEHDGLCSNLINAIEVDSDSSFWAATINGLAHVKLHFNQDYLTASIKNYYASDGLLSNSINDVVMNRDTVWLTTNNGVCYFDRREMRKTKSNPRLILENLMVNGVARGIADRFVLKHYENNLRISFVGISSGALGNLSYRYRLSGLEQTWHETKNLEIEYSLLPPGSYQFQIQAFKDDKQESVVKTIAIQIVPAFYQTLWFNAFLFILFIGIFLAISYVVLQNNKRKSQLRQTLLESENKRLQLEKEESEIKNQLFETRQKSLGLQMSPHFVFNAFNSIQEYVLTNDSEKAHHYLTEFSKLIRQFLNNNRDVSITLSKEIDFLKSYISLEEQRLKDTIRLEVRFADSVDASETLIPAMLLQPIIENAIWHGLRKAVRKVICIEIEPWNNGLQIQIWDSGKGFEGLVKSDSLGLSITRERIKLAHQQNFKEEFFTIDTHPGGGALVTIILPKIEDTD